MYGIRRTSPPGASSKPCVPRITYGHLEIQSVGRAHMLTRLIHAAPGEFGVDLELATAGLTDRVFPALFLARRHLRAEAFRALQVGDYLLQTARPGTGWFHVGPPFGKQ